MIGSAVKRLQKIEEYWRVKMLLQSIKPIARTPTLNPIKNRISVVPMNQQHHDTKVIVKEDASVVTIVQEIGHMLNSTVNTIAVQKRTI